MKYKISIIVDNQNSWFIPYARRLLEKLEGRGHEVIVSNKHEDVLNGDYAFFLSCEKIISKGTMKKNRRNLVVHESDLPKGRGWSPVTWQVLEGMNKIPITLFEADEKIDNGCIYLKDHIELEGHELIDEIRQLQAEKTIDLILRFVDDAKLKCKSQEGEPTFYKRRTPVDSELDANRSISEQFNLLRVADNERYPIFFMQNGKKYILKIYRDSSK